MPTQDNQETRQLANRLKYLDESLAALDHEEGIKGTPDLFSKVKSVFRAKKPTVTPEEARRVLTAVSRIKKEISKVVVGQDETVHMLLCAVLAKGHVLLEALPGVAKTLLIRTLAKASGCQFSRIQFTVDLLPTDITGITTFDVKSQQFTTIKGPIFAHFVLGDEINRAPPKTQSALLEAMQEKQVTIADKTYGLQSPFFVMATQNPIESAGTYRLPEAQIDRFLFKITMGYPSQAEEREILQKNITLHDFGDFNIDAVLSPEAILDLQELVQQVFVSPEIEDYIIRLVNVTRNPQKSDLRLGKYIRYGASPRASIGLFIAAKATALLHGQTYVTPQHVKDVVLPVIRHRILLTYEAETENISPDQVIEEIVKKTPLP